MSTVYVLEDGAIVRKDGDQIVVVGAKSGPILSMPIEQVEELVILGNATLTAPLVHELLGRGIGVAYFSRSGEFLGRLVPEISKNVPLRWAQFTAASDEGKTLAIAKSMVKGKLLNQRAILQREAREGVSGLASAIEDLKALWAVWTAWRRFPSSGVWRERVRPYTSASGLNSSAQWGSVFRAGSSGLPRIR